MMLKIQFWSQKLNYTLKCINIFDYISDQINAALVNSIIICQTCSTENLIFV